MIALGLVCALMFAVFFALLHFGERFFQHAQGLGDRDRHDRAQSPASVSSSFHNQRNSRD